MKDETVLFLLRWIAENAPSLVQLLAALVPVLALGIVGFALYLVSKGDKK